MSEVVFIDLEVNPQSRSVLDFGAIKSNGQSLHTAQKLEFENFIKGADYICGHNIINHDIKYFSKDPDSILIDTLYMSPLLFAERPYHKLLKDDKIMSDDLSNPLNDSIKARELFFDEVNKISSNNPVFNNILANLLSAHDEFKGFFEYVGLSESGNTRDLILEMFAGKICANSDLDLFVQNYPVELAYSLAIINTQDRASIIPHWVNHQFPMVEVIMRGLRHTPCSGCMYCDSALNPRINLKSIFGYDDFRKYDGEPLQENAVRSALMNKSLLAIFPTGGGKSLTFQLPALIAGTTARALTVVISPLQSLMKDQVDNLERRGIVDSVTINGLLSPLERQEAIERVESGVASILYISPESLRSKTIGKLLVSRQIARFVIDEAHCFSAWGQDFRVDYLYIGDFIKELIKEKGIKEIPVSCFTATAKQKVISDIKDYFREKLNIDLELFTTSASRTNLRYQVLLKDTEEDKYTTLRDLIVTKNCPTIVYVSRTKRTILLADKLRHDGIMALSFNGKMESKQKQENQDAFINDKAQVMVATSAFGMGVDKSNVKLVIHYDISDSLENYVQEAGRAGRDPKLDAECYVLYNEDDLDKHFVLNNQTKISCSEINQIWKAIKNSTRKRTSFCSSALEIARAAGWDYELSDIETRVKTALQALENAGYIQRGKNTPRIYATSILVKNFEEASEKINSSKIILSDDDKAKAKRIIKKLISSKYVAKAGNDDAESRVDYIADVLGIAKQDVIELIQSMRQEKILQDDRDISAYIDSTTEAPKTLKIFNQLCSFLMGKLNDEGISVNVKELNEEAEKLSIKSNVKSIKTILLFWKIKSYVKLEQGSSDTIVIQPQLPVSLLKAKQGKMFSVARFIVEFLIERYNVSQKNPDNLVLFSISELHDRYNHSLYKEFDVEVPDIEEALLFLAKINSMKLEGGFLVLYMGLNINRLSPTNKQYTKQDYKQLEDFYKHKIEQIHIVGEFANMMVKSYAQALEFVKDYFQLDYKKFLNKYFSSDRQKEIERNITPHKYKELFDSLSPAQKSIIDDDKSQHIVVAAGPGSGKTRVLVHKLASLLLLEDIKHEQLLMLTFSRAAALEFKQRLIKLMGNAANFVEIKTFHSYCFDIIGQVGKIEDSRIVVPKASEMILNHEVEINKITKKVLVIDEAQDMDANEFQLVEALIESNDNLRVIAVGDDDQNIYEFRGSSSKHLHALISKYNAKQYELIDNYRSLAQIVGFSNRFALQIGDRMKTNPIKSNREGVGVVKMVKHLTCNTFENAIVEELSKTYTTGTCCILTSSNQEALALLGILQLRKIPSKLIQTNEEFDLSNIAELRFFVKKINSELTSPKISLEIWERAKSELFEKYSASKCLNLIKEIIHSFEINYKDKYLSDFQVFLHESKLEDFYITDKSVVMVSTIHKAKGREFDNVYIYLNNNNIDTDEQKRKLYVGFTRAKSNLYIHYNGPLLDNLKGFCTDFQIDDQEYQKPEQMIVALSFKDVYLDFFKTSKAKILSMRSGCVLEIFRDMLMYENLPILKFSKSFSAKLNEYQKLGYKPTKAIVRFVVAWYNEADSETYAVILPLLYLHRANS